MAKKILIIDDDKDYIEALVTLLEAKGYEVHSANDGVEGLKLAESLEPNIILLDVMMTDKTEGFKVSREIKTSDKLKSIPVIIISGIRKAMNIPFSFNPDETWLPVKQVMEKPVKPEELLSAIKEHII